MCPSGDDQLPLGFVDGRHLFAHVVVASAKVSCSQQSENRLSGDRRHEATLMIEPLRIAFFGHSVADEGEARRAERQQIVSIDGEIARVLASKGCFRGSVL